jgi:hypothetical protein
MKVTMDNRWADAACGPLSLRVAATPAEVDLLRAALRVGHPLGAGRPAGHVLWQGVWERDEESGQQVLCAVLCWGGAAWRLKDRDEWIGWDPVTRANRLALVVQLRRFLVVESARRPNLASRCLGLALRQLAGQWREAHGFEPLLAESFSDPESHAGTVYKVTNWQPLGMSAGFSRQRADFYTKHDQPKRLWVYELHKTARALLGSHGELPVAYQAGVKEAVCGARSPLGVKHLGSLYDALRQVEDPRAETSRRYPIGSMLAIICLGLLGGANNVSEIWRKAGPLNQRHREALGLWRRDKAGRIKLPCYDAFNDLLAAIDPQALCRAINDWLAVNQGILPRSLALDGKAVGSLLGGIVTLCDQGSGAPAAMTVHHGAKDDCEMPAGRQLLAQVQPSLDGAVVTADALHCQKKTARVIVERGGEYILAVRDNQPKLARRAEGLLAKATPLCPPGANAAGASSSPAS